MRVIILEEVKNFILDLDKKDRARCTIYKDLVQTAGYSLRMPYSKNILPNIFELRVGGSKNIRLIYCYTGDLVCIFYAFTKKTEKIEIKEMNIIRQKYKNLII